MGSNPLDVILDALSLQLAKGSNQSTTGKVWLVLAGAADSANCASGGDGNMGEGEEHVSGLASLSCAHKGRIRRTAANIEAVTLLRELLNGHLPPTRGSG